MLSESSLLNYIRQRFPFGEALTDDCAEIPLPGKGDRLLVSTDLMEAGTHFSMDWHPPELLAEKLWICNLSDLDASGARPTGATFTMALPKDLDESWILRFLEGLALGSERHAVPILGGDTIGKTQGTGPGFGMTVFGSSSRWLKRDGLLPGDTLFVDQALGQSLRGFRKLQAGHRWDPDRPDPQLEAHLCPKPNLGLGLRLAQIPEVHACMDLSDGLCRDSINFAQASEVSIVLNGFLDPEALEGGEDFARFWGARLESEAMQQRIGLPVIPVGRVIPRGSQWLYRDLGLSMEPIQPVGFDHFLGG